MSMKKFFSILLFVFLFEFAFNSCQIFATEYDLGVKRLDFEIDETQGT